MGDKSVTNCVRLFIIKYDCFIKNYDSYYKMRLFSCKMRQLLQIASFITKCVGTYIYKYLVYR